MSTEDKFAAAWKHLEWMLKHTKRPLWFYAVKNDYKVSLVKPPLLWIEEGTAANLYDTDLNVIDTIFKP